MSSGGTAHSLVARLSTQRPGERRIQLSSVVRSALGTMPREGMQGHGWGAYVVLDTFLRDGTRESRAQGEVAQVAGEPEAVRYARCGTPQQHRLSFECCSKKATGELIDTETVTISLEGGRWKRAEGYLAGGLP